MRNPLMLMALVLGVTACGWLATARAAGTTTTRTTLREEVVYHTEESLFTGTITAHSVSNKTLTVLGHHPVRRETVMRVVHNGQNEHGHAANKPPALADESRLFHVDLTCRITLTNSLPGRLSDLVSGTPVEVSFRKMADATFIATAIQPPAARPDEPGMQPARKQH